MQPDWSEHCCTVGLSSIVLPLLELTTSPLQDGAESVHAVHIGTLIVTEAPAARLEQPLVRASEFTGAGAEEHADGPQPATAIATKATEMTDT
jgi:hypothetical protein